MDADDLSDSATDKPDPTPQLELAALLKTHCEAAFKICAREHASTLGGIDIKACSHRARRSPDQEAIGRPFERRRKIFNLSWADPPIYDLVLRKYTDMLSVVWAHVASRLQRPRAAAPFEATGRGRPGSTTAGRERQRSGFGGRPAADSLGCRAFCCSPIANAPRARSPAGAQPATQYPAVASPAQTAPAEPKGALDGVSPPAPDSDAVIGRPLRRLGPAVEVAQPGHRSPDRSPG